MRHLHNQEISKISGAKATSGLISIAGEAASLALLSFNYSLIAATKFTCDATNWGISSLTGYNPIPCPSSTQSANFAHSVTNAMIHPIDTLKNIF